jgi:DtxR family transcriptional regulator, Mn-dependent transcriptional regulator
MKKENKLTASFENYLCAIYSVEKENNAAHVKDIANFLSVGAPSVSEAMKALEKKNYIDYEPYGLITLTEQGKKLVIEKNERNEIVSDFLKNVLQAEDNEIAENARIIEYGMSDSVLEKFVRFLTFLQTCSCKEPKWIKSFKYYAKEGKLQDKCNSCVGNCSKTPVCKDNSCCGK